MKRMFVFGTNFKMNQTPAESAAFYAQLASAVAVEPGTRLFVIPPFTSLAAVAAVAPPQSDRAIWVGAQNVHWAKHGAYTGEISVPMLSSLGVDLVLLGHAERRQLFHETDYEINQKVQAALAGRLRVLLAVGETAEEHGYGVSGETVSRQLKIALHDVAADATGSLHVAYEPIWCIGAGGTPARPSDVEPIAAHIRATLAELFGDPGRAVPVLYGGSVDPNNAASFTALPNIDGLFVGRSAWTVDGFLATYEAARAGREEEAARRRGGKAASSESRSRGVEKND